MIRYLIKEAHCDVGEYYVIVEGISIVVLTTVMIMSISFSNVAVNVVKS